jgi:dsRNA-specific ribonuclease
MDEIEGKSCNPYNPVNKQIQKSDVVRLLTTYGLPPVVNNIELYQQSFVHTSYCLRPDVVPCPPDCMQLQPASNERMEFLGDGVLECITKSYLYKRFPSENEGFMTEKKIAIVKNEMIGQLACDIGLVPWLVISRHAEFKKSRSNLKKMGCLFEAFVGAIFLDYNSADPVFKSFADGPGYQAAQKFVISVFERHIDWYDLIMTDDNFKNMLQIKIQKGFKTTPEYRVLTHTSRGYETGVFLCVGQCIHTVPLATAVRLDRDMFRHINTHFKQFKQGLFLLGTGVHKIKKKSEQLACQHALSKL